MMISLRTSVLAVCALAAAATAHSQDLTRYRDFALESSVASVRAAAGPRVSEVRTLHERPARIQELEWRAPYATEAGQQADPVRDIVFSFTDDRLYQIAVRYDRDRTAGLTSGDLIASLSSAYGAPTGAAARRKGIAPDLLRDSLVLAAWENPAASVVLLRDRFSPDIRLLLTAPPLAQGAATAIKEAVRLESLDAPRLERERRRQELAEARAAEAAARTANKEAFRP